MQMYIHYPISFELVKHQLGNHQMNIKSMFLLCGVTRRIDNVIIFHIRNKAIPICQLSFVTIAKQVMRTLLLLFFIAICSSKLGEEIFKVPNNYPHCK